VTFGSLLVQFKTFSFLLHYCCHPHFTLILAIMRFTIWFIIEILLLLLEIGFQPVFPALQSSLRRRHPAIPPPLWCGPPLLECGLPSRNFSISIVFHSVDVLFPLSSSLPRQYYNIQYFADSSYFLVGYSVK